MTEYETLEIYSNTFNAWILLFTSYISIVFAFLVAATLAVDKMNSVLSAVAVTLFSMTSLFFIGLPLLSTARSASGRKTTLQLHYQLGANGPFRDINSNDVLSKLM